VPDALAADLLRNASDAVIALDAQGNVAFWNAGAESLFGWTADEILGRPSDVLIPADLADERLRFAAAMRGEPQAAMDTVRLHKDGTRLAVSCRVSPLIDAAGRPYGASAVVRDNSREVALRSELERTRQEAQARFTESPVPQMTSDTDATLIAVNPAACRFFGVSSEKQLLGRSLIELMPEPDQTEARERLVQLRSGDLDKSSHRRRFRHSTGHVLEADVTVFVVRDEAGRPARLEGIFEDVTEARAWQRALVESEERWRQLALHASDVAFLADEQGVILFVSAAVNAQFGYAFEEVVGAVGFDFFHPEDEPAVREHWARAVADPASTHRFEARVRSGDGQWRWIEETVTNSLHVPGVAAMVANLVDVTDRKLAQEAMAELVEQDPLTGAGTREGLMRALDAALADPARSARVAVVILDLDRFKLVNLSYGHRVGDDVLAETSRRLRERTFEGELVARLSGDRFAVLLEGVDSVTSLATRSKDLLTSIAAPSAVDGVVGISVTASAGAAHGPTADAVALLQAAEAALREAKADIGQPVRVVAGADSSSATERARLVEDLRRGLQADELVVQYQPVLSLLDGRVAAAGALVRWQHPERGLLGPGAFIEAAEDSGLIIEVGRKVLAAACHAAARWAHLGTAEEPFHVAVNLSAKQLTMPGVVDLVRDCLGRRGAAPRNLMLEVTESAVMADVDATSATLQQLRELGIAIAVDDFGTGYSSLTYVRRFPVTSLKIDRSFVAGLGVDDDDAAIVASVVSLARAIRVDCIAEGVETEQQGLTLQAFGCQYAQGFLWSPAVDADAFEAWVQAHDPARVLAAPAVEDPQPERRPHRRADARRQALLPAAPGVLARMSALQSQGASLATIAAALNAEQLLTLEGKRWHPRSVAQVIAAQQPRRSSG
jgi:diguanylate cyclase (GGDEF)-like protein/PAS domain S-box-containing protein